MSKYFLLAVLGAALPCVAHAEPFSGPYVGVEGGFDHYELSADVDGADYDPDWAGIGAEFDGLSGSGISGGVYAGYQMAMGGGFVSVEAFGRISGAEMKAEATDGTDTIGIKAEAKESYGGAVRAGMRINTSTAVYGRLGWLNTKFKTSIYDSVDTYSASETEDAIEFGGGIETMVGPQTSLRAEYVFSDYGEADLGPGISLNNGSARVGMAFRF